MTKLTARNRKVIHLPSLFNEDDGSPTEIIICRVSIRHIGMDAMMDLLRNSALLGEGAYRAEQGGLDAQASAENQYPGTPSHYSGEDDPRFQADTARFSEIRAAQQAMISPTYAEVVAAYGANPQRPWEGMGSEWEMLIAEIQKWSGYNDKGELVSPPGAERFPEGSRTNP